MISPRIELPTIETIEDIKKLHGRKEDEFVEAKVEIISQAEITKKIHSFLNGDQPKGYIVLGVAEKKNEILTDPPPDGITLGIDFGQPFWIYSNPKKGGQLSKKKGDIPIQTREDYEKKLINYLLGKTDCEVKDPLLGDLREKIKEDLAQSIRINFIPTDTPNHFVIVISVTQSKYRPITHTDRNVYFRYGESEPGKGDARSEALTVEKMLNMMVDRKLRLLCEEAQKILQSCEKISDLDLAKFKEYKVQSYIKKGVKAAYNKKYLLSFFYFSEIEFLSMHITKEIYRISIALKTQLRKTLELHMPEGVNILDTDTIYSEQEKLEELLNIARNISDDVFAVDDILTYIERYKHKKNVETSITSVEWNGAFCLLRIRNYINMGNQAKALKVYGLLFDGKIEVQEEIKDLASELIANTVAGKRLFTIMQRHNLSQSERESKRFKLSND